jgi:hypothetical protein
MRIKGSAMMNSRKKSPSAVLLLGVLASIAAVSAVRPAFAIGVVLGDKYTCIRQVKPELENPETKKLFDEMVKGVIGQDQALKSVAARVSLLRAGLQDPKKPFGSFLFLGPTSVGKTETVKVLVAALGGDPEVNLVKIQCNLLQKDIDVNKVLGSPPSYAGYGDPPLLAQEKLQAAEIEITMANGEKKKIVVILIDEIEKAHDDFFRAMLTALDEGQITLGDGKVVDMRNSIMIMTSNLGAEGVNALIKEKQAQFAATDAKKAFDPTGRTDPELRAQILEKYKEAMNKRLAPEFQTRIQEVVQFLHLSDEEFYKILHMKLAGFQRRIFDHAAVHVALALDKSAREYLIRRGTSYEFGARKLNNIVEDDIATPLGNLVGTIQVREGDVLYLTADQGVMNWHVVKEGETKQGLIDFAKEEYPGYKMEKSSTELAKEVVRETEKVTAKANTAVVEQNLEKIYEEDEGRSQFERVAVGTSDRKYKIIDIVAANGTVSNYAIHFSPSKGKYEITPFKGSAVNLNVALGRGRYRWEDSGGTQILVRAR